jgi:DNA repair protein RecO (recombination protein O)
MLLKSNGIVLQNFKYNDKKHIVKIFTQEKGLLTFMVNISSSTKSKMRPAFFQAFTLLSIDFTFRDNRQFFSITDVKCYYPYKSVSSDFLKSTVAMFCTELLLRCVAAEDINYELYEFVETFAKHLDETTEPITHLPNWFALHLSKHLGFFPLSKENVFPKYFNMIEGVFQDAAPMHIHFVTGDILMSFLAYVNSNLEQTQSFQIPKIYRLQIQKIILEYFQLHNHSVNNLQSVTIFTKVFSD